MTFDMPAPGPSEAQLGGGAQWITNVSHSGFISEFIDGSMKFRGLFDHPSKLYAGPFGFGVSLALLHICIRVHDVSGSHFKFIYWSMRFRGLVDPWLNL